MQHRLITIPTSVKSSSHPVPQGFWPGLLPGCRRRRRWARRGCLRLTPFSSFQKRWARPLQTLRSCQLSCFAHFGPDCKRRCLSLQCHRRPLHHWSWQSSRLGKLWLWLRSLLLDSDWLTHICLLPGRLSIGGVRHWGTY
jgi:hypothetical protein